MSQILVNSAYSYTIDGQESVLEDVANFGCGECKSVVKAYSETSPGSGVYQADPEFIEVRMTGRQYTNV